MRPLDLAPLLFTIFTTSLLAPYQTTAATVHYDWTVTNVTAALDGVTRPVLGVNGKPGHLTAIDVNMGDRVVIKVKNGLDVPTAIHFHGLLHQTSPDMDGAASITQCPIPPGGTYTYDFIVENQFGTYWWHSHFHGQYMDDLRGPFIIRNPTVDDSLGYEREYVVQLSDWYHDVSGVLMERYLNGTLNPDGDEPVFQSGLINGRGQFDCSATSLTCKRVTPSVFPVTPHSKTRLRIVNTAGFAAFLFSIDNHKLKVIEVDGTVVTPYIVDALTINVGQRYSVIVEANQPAQNYWLRAKMYHGSPWTSAPDPVGFNPNVFAIFAYTFNLNQYTQQQSNPAQQLQTQQQQIDISSVFVQSDHTLSRLPTTQSTPRRSTTKLINQNELVPFEAQSAPELGPGDLDLYYMFGFETREGDAYQKAYSQVVEVETGKVILNGTMELDPSRAVLMDLVQGRRPIEGALTVPLPLGKVVQITYINRDGGEHPFHYHGHFFYVMATGTANSLQEIPTTFRENPLRRDVVTVPACPTDEEGECVMGTDGSPAFGYSIVRFVADNAGAWLLHCHIEFHMAAGLAITFVEGEEELTTRRLANSRQSLQTCEQLDTWLRAGNRAR
ncbi:hypothetical protein HK102_012568 [Quaeritorhiza haematococci]|nr:hypothetical protein HK102_012568 [Quaeritorhiza haematococci]